MTPAELRALVAKNPRGLVDLINIAGAMPALLDRLEAAERDAASAWKILDDAPGLPLELLPDDDLAQWTDAIDGLLILFTPAIDAARAGK